MPRVQDRFSLLSIAADARTQVIAVGGVVALNESRALETRVLDGIRAGRTLVVLDLTRVAATGPGLLGVLLRIRRGVTGVRGRLALVVDGPPVSELVATSLLGRLIDVTSERAEALALVRGGPRPAPPLELR